MTNTRLINTIRSREAGNPICSVRDMARGMGMSDWTFWNTIKNTIWVMSMAWNQNFDLTNLWRISRLD